MSTFRYKISCTLSDSNKRVKDLREQKNSVLLYTSRSANMWQSARWKINEYIH